MFRRNIATLLLEWRNKKGRKPLVIRGARQVGKTSAVHQFGGAAFETYIYINLELEDDAAQGETEAQNYIASVKPDTVIPEEIHKMMMKKFHSYLLVGGMPEAVARYAETQSFIDVDPVYESILTGLRDDVSKYASTAKTKYIQHIIEHASKYVGLQIKYEKFGESNFRGRIGDVVNLQTYLSRNK